jgi:lipoprotein NlpD
MLSLTRALCLALVLLTAGCYAGKGVYHTVGNGETFWRICRTYGVEMQSVAELNDIEDPAEIRTGSRIFIPGVNRVRKVVPYSSKGDADRDKDKEGAGRIVVEKGRFSWPVKGSVSSGFGMRGAERHDGIDIRAPRGTPVRAAGDGVVAYVNSGMRGYGKIIIIEHKDDFFTVYAHNKDNYVKKGERVKKGASIASVGDTGNASGSHLHFEVRQGRGVRNPLFFLP